MRTEGSASVKMVAEYLDTVLKFEQMAARGNSTRARVMGSYWDYNAYLRGCDFVPPAATAS
jgi:hypothetical protein